MDELRDYLTEIVSDARQTREAQTLAARLLKQWDAGLVIGPKKLRDLRRLLDQPQVCARLSDDGTCPWLRKFGYLEGIPRPAPGASTKCHRRLQGSDAERYDACAGYRRQGKA